MVSDTHKRSSYEGPNFFVHRTFVGESMVTVRKDGQVVEIDCGDKMCGNCTYRKPPNCGLFDVLIDHHVCGNIYNSGSRRHPECIAAEVHD